MKKITKKTIEELCLQRGDIIVVRERNNDRAVTEQLMNMKGIDYPFMIPIVVLHPGEDLWTTDAESLEKALEIMRNRGK